MENPEKINENQWKSMKTFKILKKSMKINENQLKSDAKLPKSKFQEAARRQLAPSQAQPSPEPAQAEPSQAQGRKIHRKFTYTTY